MLNDAFEIALARVIGHEGTFQNDPADRGNWTGGRCGAGKLVGTKAGISAASYPELDIPNLTYEEIKAVYRRDWWDALKMNSYPKMLTFQLFDSAINHGSFNTNKILQRALKVKVDGHIGPISRAALSATEKNDLVFRFLGQRLLFASHIVTWEIYGKGWARRIAHNLIAAAEDN